MVIGRDQKKQMEEEDSSNISSIEQQWQAAQLFMAKGPSATLEYVGDEIRARLSAYRAQGLDGPCPQGHDGTLMSDPALRMREEAWRALGDMPEEQAKKTFVDLLTTVLPDWKKWDATHGQAVRLEQRVGGGEAERLLTAFRKRTGLQLPSSRL